MDEMMRLGDEVDGQGVDECRMEGIGGWTTGPCANQAVHKAGGGRRVWPGHGRAFHRYDRVITSIIS